MPSNVPHGAQTRTFRRSSGQNSQMVCELCGQQYVAYGPDARKGRARFCSYSCSGKSAAVRRNENAPDADDLFQAKVAMRHPDECWLWQGAVGSKGYGSLRRFGKACTPHRVAYALWVGDIPETMDVLHRCDTPLCCNPFHLFLGTQADNNADMVSKNRHAPKRGSENKWAKLTEDVVRQIRGRARLLGGKRCGAVLAAEFGVGRSTIHKIICGQTWRHIL